MAKFGKFIFLTALTSAAVYGAYSYLRKEEVLMPVNEDEDSNEYDEDLDGEPTSGRSYINLTFNKEKAEDLAKSAVKKARETITDSVQKVEEFFNDEPAPATEEATSSDTVADTEGAASDAAETEPVNTIISEETFISDDQNPEESSQQ